MKLSEAQQHALSDERMMSRLLAAKTANALLLRSKPNVVGLGIGLRVRRGELTLEPNIKVYVSAKVPRHYIADHQLVPPTVEHDGDNFPVDVEQADVPVAQLYNARVRPVHGGASIGAQGGMTGTLGCCITLPDKHTYILSNNHILANVDQLAIGTNILQPGPADGGVAPASPVVPNDLVATLSKTVPIDFGTTTITIFGQTFTFLNTNRVDCALARVTDRFNDCNRKIHWVGYPNFLADVWPNFFTLWGATFHKMGRSTDYTTGTLLDPFWDGIVDYSPAFGNAPLTNLAWFADQIKILSPTRAGDSGSLWLEATTNKPFGLTFAGNNDTFSVANPIHEVMQRLGIPRI